tara:strand:+ start:330 stop:524 length:195 start_codon:yes stop_codon:yes gene_type:complete
MEHEIENTNQPPQEAQSQDVQPQEAQQPPSDTIMAEGGEVEQESKEEEITNCLWAGNWDKIYNL